MERVIAARLQNRLGPEGLPDAHDWNSASPVAFCADWRGRNPDPQRETELRLLWSPEYLFARFRCRYRSIYVYEGAQGRRDRLWLRDVAEIFIQPEPHEVRRYREFEISPNGDWLDLDIAPGQKLILECDLKTRVAVDAPARIWTAELGIPIEKLTRRFDPEVSWRANVFRIEGKKPSRFYSAWQPTHTPEPNFHVPECFAELRLVP
jgi:alpha-galactosidase